MSHETCVIKTANAKRFALAPLFFVNALVTMALVFITAINSFADTEKPVRKMVILGDSLVAGYGLAPGQAFPEQLQRALEEKGIALKIENAGVSGDTTTGGLARLDWSVGEGTDLVLVELGANDALRGISPEVTRANLETAITRLKARGITVLLAGMQAPPNMGEDYANRFNPIYSDLATAHDVPLYPFFLEGVAAQSDLNQSDGIHPNAEGVSVMVDNFLPFLEENLPAG